MSCKRCQMSGIDCMTSGDHSWTSGCVCWTSGNRGRMSGSHCLMSVDDCRMSGDHRRTSCNRCTTSCCDCRTSGRGRSTSVSHRNPSPKAWRATRGGCRRSVGDGSCPRRGSVNCPGFPRRSRSSKDTAVQTRPARADHCDCACVSGCRTARCNRTRPPVQRPGSGRSGA